MNVHYTQLYMVICTFISIHTVKLVLNSHLCIVYECTLYTAIYGNLYFYINTYSQTVSIQQSPLEQMQK